MLLRTFSLWKPHKKCATEAALIRLAVDCERNEFLPFQPTDKQSIHTFWAKKKREVFLGYDERLDGVRTGDYIIADYDHVTTASAYKIVYIPRTKEISIPEEARVPFVGGTLKFYLSVREPLAKSTMLGTRTMFVMKNR